MEATRLRQYGRLVTAYVLVPNLLFLVLNQFVFISRPLISVDYLLLAAVAGMLPLAINIVLLASVLAIDAFITLAPVFHFGLETAVFSVPYGLRLRIGVLILLIVGAIALASFLVIWSRISKAAGCPRFRLSAVVMAALFVLLDALGGTNGVFRADAAIPLNVATSQVYRLSAAVYRATGRRQLALPVVLSYSDAATGDLKRMLDTIITTSADAALPDVVLVIVESWGHFAEPGRDSLVMAPLLSTDIRALYDVRVGLVPAHGATTSGELREMCSVRSDYRSIAAIRTDNCLPNVLRRMGFETVAFHGFTGSFFDRRSWYPAIGFERMEFVEDLAHNADRMLCGSTFRGICDQDVANSVDAELRSRHSQRSRFIYWLTLSSHLPLDLAAPRDSTVPCMSIHGTNYQTVCELMQLHGAVFQSIARMALLDRPHRPRFIVVGDHPPPFLSRSKRALFSVNEVPFVELIPKATRERR